MTYVTGRAPFTDLASEISFMQVGDIVLMQEDATRNVDGWIVVNTDHDLNNFAKAKMNAMPTKYELRAR